jgi:hypothetical protein
VVVEVEGMVVVVGVVVGGCSERVLLLVVM